MENLKPTQSREQEQRKTLEDYVVKTFPADTDPDNARYPLTIIRSGQDGEDVRPDEGWNPIRMLVVCDTDSEKGIGPIKLFMEVYKLVKVNGEYTTETEIVPLENIQGLGADEGYIEYLYGKTPEEMIEEGERAAKQISNSSVVEEDSPDFERPKVSLKIGSTAVKAAGVREPVETNKVDTNEPVREPVETDKTGAGSSTLVMTEEVMASIGAIKVNDPGSLAATEIVREEPVETYRASADLVDLPAAKSVENPVVEKSMEMNEVNTDILPESFKAVINDFEKYAEGNNGEFLTKVDKNLRLNLDQLQLQIQSNPEAIKELATEELIRRASSMIMYLETSRAESANKFKNNINDILEDLKKKIKNDDERRRLVKITEHVGQMGKDNKVLGRVTNGLLDKLIKIRSYIAESQRSSWGIDHYKSNITQVIGEIINDLSIVSERRQNIVGGIEGIKSEGYYQKR